MSYADSPSLFSGLAEIYLSRGKGRAKKYAVRAARPHKNFVLLTLAGVEDRDRADALRGAEVSIPEEMLPEPGDNELYLREIIGIQVRLPDGRVLGEVRSVDRRGDSEVWSVRTPGGEEILLPAADEFITGLDLDLGLVTMDPPPGLLEIYLGGEEKE